MRVLPRSRLEAAVAIAIPLTILLFAFGSSSVQVLVRLGSPGRWVALLMLATLSLARLVRVGRVVVAPAAWALSGALLLLGAESALWSVDPRLTLERVFTLGVLFVAAAALALGLPKPRHAAARVLGCVLVGITLVALASLLVLLVSHRDAVQAATAAAGWRFQGLGENPNTVSMLLAVGLPLAVWRALTGARRPDALGIALVLLFAGEIAASGSRGALVAGFAGALATALALGRTFRAKAVAATAVVLLAAVCVFISRLPAAAVAAPSSHPVHRTTGSPRHRGIDAEAAVRLDDEIGHPPLGAYRPLLPRTLLGSSGRAQAWNGALRQGGGRPIAGYGFGTEDHVFVDRYYAFQGGLVEDTYLGLFLQLGAAGVVLFVALLAVLLWTAMRLVRRSPPGPAGAALGVLLAAILLGIGQSALLSVGNIAASSIWMCSLVLPAIARESTV